VVAALRRLVRSLFGRGRPTKMSVYKWYVKLINEVGCIRQGKTPGKRQLIEAKMKFESILSAVQEYKQDMQCTYNVRTIVAVEKQLMLHILSLCLEPKVSSMQCACTILSFVACPALHTFSTLSHKQHDFPKNVTEYKMCVLIFCATFISNVSHSKKN
jgi:hypothetical protein